MMGVLLLPVRAGASGDPERPPDLRLTSLFPGGDVLRPDRSGPSEFRWYLGIDAGPNYSSFYNGPLLLSVPDPYYSNVFLSPEIDKGNGIGFNIAAVIDLGFTKTFGLIGKIQYNSRAGKFNQTWTADVLDVMNNNTVTATWNDDVNWTFSYIGFDLLARIQFSPDSWYMVVGPSFNSLSANTAKVTQTILSPANFFYVEETVFGPSIANQYRVANVSAKISNVKSSRIDLKAGVGTWIPLGKKVSLTPELTFGYPLTELVQAAPGNADIKFNMFTIFFTVGLRWKMN
jgi:hypothetical protein